MTLTMGKSHIRKQSPKMYHEPRVTVGAQRHVSLRGRGPSESGEGMLGPCVKSSLCPEKGNDRSRYSCAESVFSSADHETPTWLGGRCLTRTPLESVLPTGLRVELTPREILRMSRPAPSAQWSLAGRCSHRFSDLPWM